MCRKSWLAVLPLLFVIFGDAQSLTGTWLASYDRDQPGNKRTFYYRFYLKDDEDSLYGVAEALSADTDIKSLPLSTAVVVNRFRINLCQTKIDGDSNRIVLCAGSPLYQNTIATASQQPPLFLQFHLQIVNELPVSRINSLPSLIPFNDGSIAKVSAQKIGTHIPDFVLEDEDGSTQKTKKGLPRLSLLFKERTAAKNVVALANTFRSEEVQHQLEVNGVEASIDVYDNGLVDDDTVSLYLNDELLIRAQKVSSRPLHINTVLQKGKENKLVLYAHNLGSVPPNTALVILMVGGKRYELRLASSLSKNATAIITVQE